MSDLLFYAVALCWTVAATLFAWYALGVARQITYVTLADGRRQERTVPLLFRLLLPLAPNVKPLMTSPGMAVAREKADAMLVTGGFEGLIVGWEFLSLKLLVPLCVGPFWVLFVHACARFVPALQKSAPMLDVIGLLLLYVRPLLWLRRAVARRQRAILRGLPFVLDLLTLSVEAGLDFMSALQRNVERRKLDALGEELVRVIREIQLGNPRRHALKAMSKRVDLPDMRSVVNALVQADELGVSIGAILRIQSDQIRQRRFDRAERLANEAPVKLLGPLLLFIFPSVFLILLGPVLYRLSQQMF
jgi:tight adherence protein C